MFSAPSSTLLCINLATFGRGFCLLLTLSGLASGTESAVFTPPQAYPATRYEAGWSKNPFTLKTAAPIAAQDSFARDFAIGAHYGAADNPTVVIVNTKTNERILLRKDKPSPGGIRLQSVHLSSTRSECKVEVMRGSEAAVLGYDAGYLSQLAANEASRMTSSKALSAPAANGLRLPPLPAAKRPASSSVKVSSMEPPVPVQNRMVLPSLPLPQPSR